MHMCNPRHYGPNDAARRCAPSDPSSSRTEPTTEGSQMNLLRRSARVRTARTRRSALRSVAVAVALAVGLPAMAASASAAPGDDAMLAAVARARDARAS